jgi:hypothetical protein
MIGNSTQILCYTDLFGDFSIFPAVGVMRTAPGRIMFDKSFSFWSSSSLETIAPNLKANLVTFKKCPALSTFSQVKNQTWYL